MKTYFKNSELIKKNAKIISFCLKNIKQGAIIWSWLRWFNRKIIQHNRKWRWESNSRPLYSLKSKRLFCQTTSSKKSFRPLNTLQTTSPLKLERNTRVEPMTFCLVNRYSTNWANTALRRRTSKIKLVTSR